MNSVVRPRGRLPRRVYWTRRLLVLGVVALLVFGAVQLVGGSGSDAQPIAGPVHRPSNGITPSASLASTPTAPAVTQHARSSRRHQHRPATTPSPTPTPLAVPTGPCQNGDVQITPAVRRAYAGQDVTITLDLTTKTSPACTWEVSPQTVVVDLTSGSDRIWSSQDCPSALGRQSVVVRRDAVTKVSLDWGGRRSDSGCSKNTLWAQPGWYHVEAAAYGAGPADAQFRLLQPPRPTITKPPKPAKHRPAPSSPSASGTATSSPTSDATASPSAG